MKSKKIRNANSWEPGKALGYLGPSHLITVAPTRKCGRGRDVLIFDLLDWPYRDVVLDPKGELTSVTNPRRATGATYADEDELRKGGLI